MRAALWFLVIWFVVPCSLALQFAVSPPQLVLDDLGGGVLAVINPADSVVWYEVLGSNQSGVLGAFEQKNLILYPQEEFVTIRFRDAASSWIVSELAVPVFRQDSIVSTTMMVLFVIVVIVVGIIGLRAVLNA